MQWVYDHNNGSQIKELLGPNVLSSAETFYIADVEYDNKVNVGASVLERNSHRMKEFFIVKCRFITTGGKMELSFMEECHVRPEQGSFWVDDDYLGVVHDKLETLLERDENGQIHVYYYASSEQDMHYLNHLDELFSVKLKKEEKIFDGVSFHDIQKEVAKKIFDTTGNDDTKIYLPDIRMETIMRYLFVDHDGKEANAPVRLEMLRPSEAQVTKCTQDVERLTKFVSCVAWILRSDGSALQYY
jgi:hypothetical protein